jgi:hypothetical protein
MIATFQNSCRISSPKGTGGSAGQSASLPPPTDNMVKNTQERPDHNIHQKGY